MISRDIPLHAVVPYIAPKKSFASVCKYALLHASRWLYAFFEKRKAVYGVFLAFLSVGVLVGSYFSSLHSVDLAMQEIVNYFCAVLVLSVVSSFSFLGIVFIPCLLLLFGMLCGMFPFSAALGIVSILFLLIVFFACLLFAESFCAARRCLLGFKQFFFRKDMLVHAFLFLASLLSCKLLLFLISVS